VCCVLFFIKNSISLHLVNLVLGQRFSVTDKHQVSSIQQQVTSYVFNKR
jgi:hypothetical protein